jgi:hypothetical protein
MSRSGYDDADYDPQISNLWQGAIASAIRGRRCQAFLRELLAALDALPEKKLIDEDLEAGGQVCALGAVGRARGLNMSAIDPEDREGVCAAFKIPMALACTIMHENDQDFLYWKTETPEQRFAHMRRWVVSQIKAEAI